MTDRVAVVIAMAGLRAYGEIQGIPEPQLEAILEKAKESMEAREAEPVVPAPGPITPAP